MPTGFPDMRENCALGRAVAFGRRRREKEGRHTHYLSSLSRDGIPKDWERCKEGGMLVGEGGVGGVLQEDERFEA